jgi:hypothetical protein
VPVLSQSWVPGQLQPVGNGQHSRTLPGVQVAAGVTPSGDTVSSDELAASSDGAGAVGSTAQADSSAIPIPMIQVRMACDATSIHHARRALG